MSSAGTTAAFAITDTKLCVQVVTFKIEDNAKLLSEGFKRSVYWNKCKVILKDHAANNYIRERLDASFQGVNRPFVLVYAYGNNITNENAYRRYFLPRLKIENYNIETNGRNFYDQPVNDMIKQYEEIRNISTGQGLHNWFFVRFCLFWKKLQTNFSWFKQTKGFRCRLKSNSTNYFYWKNK